MARDLPAELLREILSPPLLVPDEMFADNGAVSPFSKVEKSASDVLLVCKSWMRAATPWLYSTVIVRSMAQAKALALALTNNPDFGKFIRRLRVEGAYGEYIWAAVKTAPNITDLCMTLTVWSDVSSAGLIKSLAYINPRRVILTLAPVKTIRNKNHEALLKALCTQIQSWSRLTIFQFAGTGIRIERWVEIPDYIAFPSIVTALCSSRNLEETQLTFTNKGDTIVSVICRLLGDDIRRTVRLCGCTQSNDSWFKRNVQDVRAQTATQLHPRILTDALSTDLGSRSEPSALPTPVAQALLSSSADAWLPNPFYKPLDCLDPLTRHALLTRIFRHALEIKLPAPLVSLLQGRYWFDSSRFDAGVARVLVETSQEFESVATDILIKYVSINHETHAKDLLKTISDKPTLSARVSTLRVRHSGAPTATQIELLERLSQLSDATIPVSQAAIEALVRSGSSKTLRKLALQSPYIIASPTEPLDISNFLVLEELVINYPHYMPYSTMKGKHLDKLPALPRLRRLHLSSAPRDIIFSLTEYSIPQLEYLQCDSSCMNEAALTSFITRHGAHIREARLYAISASLWDALPEMAELHWKQSISDVASVIAPFATNGHANLRILRISAPIPTCGGPHRRKNNTYLNEMWTVLLTESVTRLKFPALELIQLVEGRELWPASEREAKKSIWPALAEALERDNITLTDGEGRAWRRRLQ